MSLAGKNLVFTGTLSTDRKKATAMAVAAGAKVTGDVSGTTTHLVAGPGAGSKVAKAESKGVTIWTEDDFLAAVGGSGGGGTAAAPKAKAAGKRKPEEAATATTAKKSKGKAPAAPAAASSSKGKSLAGKVLVFTGTLSTDRKKATRMAETAGAKVTGAVSGTTTHLVAGPGAGSKVAAAEAKGVTIWTEDDFLASLGGD
jgi:NAD-dependent DNA ligase